MARALGLILVAMMLACGSGSSGPAPAPGSRVLLQVRGADLSGGAVHLDVMVAGQVVDDAVVHINGQRIPFRPATGRYEGDLTVPVAAGGALALEVARGAATVAGTGLVPEVPILTAPTAGKYVSAGEDLLVTWTSTTSPDAFAVSARWSCGASCGTGTLFEVPGSARSFTIPAGTLPQGTVELAVLAYNDGQLGGDYEPTETAAGMNIRGESESVALSVGEHPGRGVSGTVSGVSAEVRLDLACPGAPMQTIATDAGGAFVFDDVPPATCTLTPACAGYAFDPPEVTVPAGSEPAPAVRFVARPLLQVRGRAITVDAAHVEVRHLDEPVEDAVVRLDGQVIPHNPTTGTYSVLWATPLSAGAVVSLEVTRGAASVTGSGVVPEAPVLTAPAPDAALPAGQDVVVSWSSATSPESFLVSVIWSCGDQCGAGRSFHAAGSARSLTLAAAELPAGELEIFVAAINDGVLGGDYDPSALDVDLGPGMNIEATSTRVQVSR